MKKAARSRWLVLAAVLAVSPTVIAEGVTVVKRERLGNNAEDITYVSAGKYKGDVAIADGAEVLVVDATKSKKGGAKRAFDFSGWNLAVAPRGITFVQSEDRFFLVDPTQPGQLLLADDAGALVETRSISYLGGFFPTWCEGLSYIPPGNPTYPDHWLMAAQDENYATRIEVIQRDGQVVAEIFPAAPLSDQYLTGMAFVAPDRIIVTAYATSDIYTLDFAGTVIGGPVTVAGETSSEGLAQIGDGAVVAADYASGRLAYFDDTLDPTPDRDRSFAIGIAVSRFYGGSWDPLKDEYVLPERLPAAQMANVDEKATAVTGRRPLPSDAARYRDTAFVPADNLLAMARTVPPRIDLYDAAGTNVEQIDLSWLGSPFGVAYVESTGEFAVTTTVAGQRQIVTILGRDGSYHRSVDLSPLGVTAASFIDVFDPSDPSGGKMIFAADGDRLFVTDLNGNLLQEVDNVTASLGGSFPPAGITAITTGKYAGAFFTGILDTSELIVFRLD